MNERMFGVPKQIQTITLTPEQEEMIRLANEQEVVSKTEALPEIKKLEEAMDLFESELSVSALEAIKELPEEGEPTHFLRESAKIELRKITNTLIYLRDKTDISPEAFAKLRSRQKLLALSVGALVGNKIDREW